MAKKKATKTKKSGAAKTSKTAAKKSTAQKETVVVGLDELKGAVKTAILKHVKALRKVMDKQKFRAIILSDWETLKDS